MKASFSSILPDDDIEEVVVLPSRALNDVFIGESISARVSYFEMNVNSKCNSKHKCSGLVVATGLRMGMNWIHANVLMSWYWDP